MALGRRKREQQELWVATSELPMGPGHPFYVKLNELFDTFGFDAWIERRCAAYYAERIGRPGIPPGVYFRMQMIGYLEGLDSQRGIAWRCADSRSLAAFLGYGPTDKTPDHSSLSNTSKRLPLEVHEEIFAFVLKIAQEKGLLGGKTVAMDATLIEANAAMKSIVRRDTGDDWKAYIRKLMAEAGIHDPTDEEMRRFDRKRKSKKVSNAEWVSQTDPDSRIAKMKDGRTHAAYKTEHVVDLESDLLLAATVHPGDRGDPESGMESLAEADETLRATGSQTLIEEAAADKGYHSNALLADCRACGIRTYIPERKQRGRRRWKDKPATYRETVYANRRRVRGERGKRLGRLRSEYVERTFAHMCETGAARRTWLRGLEKVKKRYTIHAAGRNLGVILRALCGVGTPRSLQTGSAGCFAALQHRIGALLNVFARFRGVPNDAALNATRFDRIFTANVITRAAA